VVEPEGEHHRARRRVELRFAGLRPIRIAAQILVEIPTVKIDQVIRRFYDLFTDRGKELAQFAYRRACRETSDSYSCCRLD